MITIGLKSTKVEVKKKETAKKTTKKDIKKVEEVIDKIEKNVEGVDSTEEISETDSIEK